MLQFWRFFSYFLCHFVFSSLLAPDAFRCYMHITSISEGNTQWLKFIRTIKKWYRESPRPHFFNPQNFPFSMSQMRDELNTCVNNICIYCSKKVSSYYDDIQCFFSIFNLNSFHFSFFASFFNCGSQTNIKYAMKNG